MPCPTSTPQLVIADVKMEKTGGFDDLTGVREKIILSPW